MIRTTSALAIAIGMLVTPATAAEPPLEVLFLGDQGHHRPAERFAQLQPVLARRGIELVYTERLADLRADVLGSYDALVVYANIDALPADGEAAILDFVRGGKGLVPLHCASFCFRDSPAWIDLVGAQLLQRLSKSVDRRLQLRQHRHWPSGTGRVHGLVRYRLCDSRSRKIPSPTCS